MLPAKFSDWQAILRTDWLSILIEDTSAYLVYGHFEVPQTQISLATIVIGKNINEPENSYTRATTHRNYRIYTDTHILTSKTTFSVNSHIQPDPRRFNQPLFTYKK
jgi:hypothetical protein